MARFDALAMKAWHPSLAKTYLLLERLCACQSRYSQKNVSEATHMILADWHAQINRL
jgi:hypothetical protein